MLQSYDQQISYGIPWYCTGYEVSGIVDDICGTLMDSKIQTGDRVIVYPEDNTEDCINDG